MKLTSGQQAPLFSTKDIFGNTIDLAQIQDQKIILSFFRYAECPMCNLQIAKIMQQKEFFFKHNLKLITVFESSTESLKESIAERHAFDFTIIADTNRELYQLYGVHPSWVKTMRTLSFTGMQHFKLALKMGFKEVDKIEGRVNQIPADFLINTNKTIQIAHYGDSIIDHYPLEELFKNVER